MHVSYHLVCVILMNDTIEFDLVQLCVRSEWHCLQTQQPKKLLLYFIGDQAGREKSMYIASHSPCSFLMKCSVNEWITYFKITT